MVPDLAGDVDRRSLMDLWRSKAGIRAVREEKVHILGEDYVVVPGPRFVDLLEDMAEIINPIEN
jgi:ABC-type Fe3+-hydroxamate transport system substrate-binding protein